MIGIMCGSRTQRARKYQCMKRVLEGKYHSSLLGSEFVIRKSIGFFKRKRNSFVGKRLPREPAGIIGQDGRSTFL